MFYILTKVFYTILEIIKSKRNIQNIRLFLYFTPYSEIIRREETEFKIKSAAFCMHRKGAKLTQASFDSLRFLKLTSHLGLENLWIRENLQTKFQA